MRTLALIATAALLIARPATADAGSVEVTISLALSERADSELGRADIQRLAATLRLEVQEELGRSEFLNGARLELELIDARPNRPTSPQLRAQPGLSFQSIGNGGAAFRGRARLATGEIVPIAYNWYGTDLREAYRKGRWTDAEIAIQRFASVLARGQLPRSR